MPLAAKACWEVRSGIIPRQLDHRNIHKQFWYTSGDWEADQRTMEEEAKQGLDPCRPDAPKTIFQQRKDEAVAYWNEWNDPRTTNWTELTFIWF